MKKLFTLCLSFIFGALAVSAQVDDVFQFTDGENGPVIPDGSRIVRNVVETNPAGNMIPGNLWLKNVGGTPGAVSIKYDVLSMTPENSRFQMCFPSNCYSTDVQGYHFESPRGGGPVSLNQDIMTEWITSSEGSCEVTYQVFRHTAASGGETYPGSKITVLYTTDPNATGISGVTTTESREVVARYTLDGQLLSAPQKGINIVKYADGRTEKVLVK